MGRSSIQHGFFSCRPGLLGHPAGVAIHNPCNIIAEAALSRHLHLDRKSPPRSHGNRKHEVFPFLFFTGDKGFRCWRRVLLQTCILASCPSWRSSNSAREPWQPMNFSTAPPPRAPKWQEWQTILDPSLILDRCLGPSRTFLGGSMPAVSSHILLT
ncbi:hypothetical protein BR93DRAFT_502431 [Coniochaeta sp. PMI_546]|nr:hypothetical protein BR93DRAFT_502431 [Coniochaeta sp. PMI_546]